MLNIQAALVVLFPIIVGVALLSQGSWRVRFTLTRDLGIPVGIIGSLIGMTQMMAYTLTTSGSEHRDGIYPATGVMLLTIFYGGILSAAAHFLTETKWAVSDHNGWAPVGFWRPSIVVSSLVLILLYAIFSKELFYFFFDRAAVLICGFSVVLALLVSSPGRRPTNLSRALLFSSMVAVIAGLITLFMGDKDKGLFVAANGLLYGLVGYVILYIWYAGRPEGETINAPLTNWHWMEVTGFFIFMFLAPDTILDNFQEEAVQQQIQELQSEIAILRGDRS